MKFTRYSVLFLVLIGLLAMYFFNDHETKPQTSATQKTLIDERMSGIHAKQFDQQGKLTHDIYIASALHYKGALDTDMTEPSLTLYQNDSTWTITAKKGLGHQSRIGGHFHQVDLADEVHVDCASTSNKSWHLTTNMLQIYPENKIAKTESIVTLFSDGFTMEALGMRAEMDKKQVEFLSKVKSSYEIPKG